MKLVLLFNLVVFWARAQTLVSADRYFLRIIDRTVSEDDLNYQLRNLKALDCIYDNAILLQYFKKAFIKDFDKFVTGLPKGDEELRKYLHGHEDILKQIRHLFKMLRYAEDQKNFVSPDLEKIIRESSKENRCGSSVLYKDTLKTNFKTLMELELYLKSRYGGQLKTAKFDVVKPAIDLFLDSLDKQFAHEYYW